MPCRVCTVRKAALIFDIGLMQNVCHQLKNTKTVLQGFHGSSAVTSGRMHSSLEISGDPGHTDSYCKYYRGSNKERESELGIGPVYSSFPFTVYCYLYQESIKRVLLSFSLLTTLCAAFEALSWTTRGNQADCLFSVCVILQSSDQKYFFQWRTLHNSSCFNSKR